MTHDRIHPGMATLRDDRRAITSVEFALVAPVMVVLMMGFCDLTYQIYAQSILSGAVQQAGRDSGIEGGANASATIDARVVSLIAPVVPNLVRSCVPTVDSGSRWCSTRKSYDSFTSVAPEPFVDGNGDGIRDPGECFTDINGNGAWDADPAVGGQGGASDVAVYTMSVSYRRLFPLSTLIGMPGDVTISAATLLKNQPYATQRSTAAPTVCS